MLKLGKLYDKTSNLLQSLEDEIGLYRNLMQKTDSFVGSGTTVKALRPKLITTEVEGRKLFVVN